MTISSRISAFLAYLLLIIGWLYIFLFCRDDKLAVYHVKQAVMLILTAVGSFVVWVVAGWIISLIPVVGFIIAVALFSLVIATFILLVVDWIIGMIYALQAKSKPLPVVGRWGERLPF